MPAFSEMVGRTYDAMNVKRVFGDPIERDGVTLIPVASVWGGGGGGEGGDEPSESGGSGGGFGVIARPIGVYEIREGSVTWRPTFDLMRVLTGVLVIAGLGIVFGSLFGPRR